jgi:hypothetical protein
MGGVDCNEKKLCTNLAIVKTLVESLEPTAICDRIVAGYRRLAFLGADTREVRSGSARHARCRFTVQERSAMR